MSADIFQYATEIIVAFFGAMGAIASVYLTSRGRADAKRQEEVSAAIQVREDAREEFSQELKAARESEAKAWRHSDRLEIKNDQLRQSLRSVRAKLKECIENGNAENSGGIPPQASG